MEARSRPLPSLAHEMEVQVLLRLPVESLVRFKAVSRLWLSSISDPKFVQSHRDRAKRRYDTTVLCKRSDRSLYSLAMDGSVQRFDRFVPTASVDGPKYMKQPEILGSCNGCLFGFTDYDEAYCWNPGTGRYVRVRCPETLADRDGRYALSGLGRDPATGDFKAVVAFNYVSPPGSPPPEGYIYAARHAYILSFKTRTWNLGGCPYDFFSNGVGTLFRGNPHWVVKSSPSRRDLRSSLIYFDAAAGDRFEELPLPPTPTQSLSDLGILGGRELCAFHIAPGSSTVEVWSMKEYGVQESWTQLFDVPLFSSNLKPLCFTSSDEVLLAICKNLQFGDPDLDEDGDLFLYDPKTHSTRKIMVPTASDCPSRCYRLGYTAFALEDTFDWLGDSFSADTTDWYYKSQFQEED